MAATSNGKCSTSIPNFKPLPEKWDLESLTEHIIVHYRWIFVMFLLPVSLCYDIYHFVRSYVVFQMNSAPSQHVEKVKSVQKQVQEWNDAGSMQPMCTARPGWQTISPQNMDYKKRMYQVSINLVDIVKIDTEKRTVKCEPLVTMGQLSRALNNLGWTIPILPELDDLTVGGLVMGTGIETSSHKYGLFQHICKSFELVMADSSVTYCSEEENSDLFHAVPWSYGTLGFLVAAEIEIIPCKRFIKLDYYPTYSLEETIKTFEREVNKRTCNEFVECLVYSKSKAVVMTGNFTDSANPGMLNEIGIWHKPWFFKHVEEKLECNGLSTEFIPIRDYYHRHSRSIFWEIQDIIPFGNNVLFRYLFGWLIPPKVSLLKLTQGKTLKKLYEEHHMIQDMLVPISQLKGSLECFHQEVEIYPVWLCPFKLPNNPGMLKTQMHKGENGSRENETMFVDVGVYGVPRNPAFETVSTTRKIESFVRDVKGFQMMYADSYMSKEEFREMFDHTLYDEMREKYQCTKAFPDVYDKVNKAARSGVQFTVPKESKCITT